VGCLMIWMLPVPVLAVTLSAVGMQLRATRLFSELSCQHRRINHSLSTHLTARRSWWRYLRRGNARQAVGRADSLRPTVSARFGLW